MLVRGASATLYTWLMTLVLLDGRNLDKAVSDQPRACDGDPKLLLDIRLHIQEVLPHFIGPETRAVRREDDQCGIMGA